MGQPVIPKQTLAKRDLSRIGGRRLRDRRYRLLPGRWRSELIL
jgi:hypothetical protein